MATRIYLPSTGSSEWRRLLADPEKHWKEGYSARSAAERWEASEGLPLEIARQFNVAGFAPVDLLLAIPEWKTSLPGGQRESQTDIFALVRTTRGVFSCGIEAKVAEAFGPSVGEWQENASLGKAERLAYICQKLGLAEPPSPLLRYQLLHRTASAIIEAERFGCSGAAMLVHSFSADRLWLDDFRQFVMAMGGEAEPDSPALLQLPSGMPLLLGWACGPAAGHQAAPAPQS